MTAKGVVIMCKAYLMGRHIYALNKKWIHGGEPICLFKGTIK